MRLSVSNEPVLWLGALLMLGGFAGLAVSATVDRPLLSTVLGHIGGISIGAGFVDLLNHFVMARRLMRQVSSQVIYALQLPLEDFYQNRHELPRLEQELQGAAEIWLAWHVGSVQGAGTLPFRTLPCQNSRLLLTHPDSPQLDGLAKVLGRSKESMRVNIIELTRHAVDCGVAVRWFDGPLGSSMVITNPMDQGGWARLEFIIPYERPTERPSIRVSTRKGQAAYQKAVDAYKQMWEHATDAPAGVSNGLALEGSAI